MMTVGLQAAHGMIAMVTRTPEMECNEDEAKAIADPLVRLMDHYSVVPPPEVILWTNLFSALAFVEGPRIALIRLRRMEEARNRQPMKPVYDSAAGTVAPDTSASFGGGPAASGAMN